MRVGRDKQQDKRRRSPLLRPAGSDDAGESFRCRGGPAPTYEKHSEPRASGTGTAGRKPTLEKATKTLFSSWLLARQCTEFFADRESASQLLRVLNQGSSRSVRRRSADHSAFRTPGEHERPPQRSNAVPS